MSYIAAAGDAPAFTNVFVEPGAYRHYLETGHWPDKTVFVLEVYSSAIHGSINKQGRYQDALLSLDVEVKDESRFPEKWAYFRFGPDAKTAPIHSKNDCWSCHDQNAAVENTFAQFYPTLLRVAYEKGTIKPAIHLTPSVARVEQIASEKGWGSVEPVLDQIRAGDPEAEVLKESSLNSIGYRMLSTGKTGDAVAAFERAARDYPRSANAYDTLADAYLAAGNKAKALECSQKALELAPKDAALSEARRRQIENSAKQRIAKLKERR